MTQDPSTAWTPRRNRGWVYTDVVDGAADGWTALRFYARRYPHSAESTWAERLRGGQVRRAAERIGPEVTLAAGQRIEYHRPPWDEPPAPRDFRVIWDDGDVLAVEKPSGLQVLPAAELLENTLLHVVRERVAGEPAPAHRLGRGTSGIVLFARTWLARRGLAEAFREGRLRKVYRALVGGVDVAGCFTVTEPIGRLPYPGLGHVFAATAHGKPSTSHVRRLEVRPHEQASLVEVEIPTGRPHQIRIHLAAAGHPLVGEPFFEVGGRPGPPAPGRPALPGDTGYHLHAMQVAVGHPVTGARLCFYCRPPSELEVGAAD